MAESVKVTIHTEKIEKEYSHSQKSKRKEIEINGNFSVYVSIIFNIMNALTEKCFYADNEKTVISESKYLNVINNIIRNFKNSKKITNEEFSLLSENPSFKEYILMVMIDLGFVESDVSGLIFNLSKIEEHKKLMIENKKDILSLYNNSFSKLVRQSKEN
jgi:hypothetical protein